MTGHPGINLTVPYGAVFRSLEEARKDALNRCSLTNLAWGQCARHGVFPSIAKKLLVRWTHRSGKVVSEKMVRFGVSF
jgi:hypothetical protein